MLVAREQKAHRRRMIKGGDAEVKFEVKPEKRPFFHMIFRSEVKPAFSRTTNFRNLIIAKTYETFLHGHLKSEKTTSNSLSSSCSQ